MAAGSVKTTFIKTGDSECGLQAVISALYNDVINELPVLLFIGEPIDRIEVTSKLKSVFKNYETSYPNFVVVLSIDLETRPHLLRGLNFDVVGLVNYKNEYPADIYRLVSRCRDVYVGTALSRKKGK